MGIYTDFAEGEKKSDLMGIYEDDFFKPGEVALFSYIRVYISFSDCLDRQRVF